MSHLNYATALNTIDGQATTLEVWREQTLLIVNVASQCGLTPQYEALEKVYRRYKAQGLVVLGMPCNQFLNQEPGSEAEIQHYCTTTWNITFPLFAKLEVNGPGRHPLYRQLVSAIAESDRDFYMRLVSKGREPVQQSDILWNFEKFLINRRGEVVGRFSPDLSPESPAMIAAIEDALAA